MSESEDIKKLVKENKAALGTNEVMKLLKLGKLSAVYVTSNCPGQVKEDIAHYAALAKVQVIEIPQANDELGVVCKKPYSISVLGAVKGA